MQLNSGWKYEALEISGSSFSQKKYATVDAISFLFLIYISGKDETY